LEKIRSFTDLIAWKKGHQLVISIYKITSNFSQKEIFALTNQMCRCAISITSNIAEGFSRKSPKEKIQFYHMSLGSLTELQNQLLIAKDINYLPKEKFIKLAEQTVEASKLINGLIRSLKNIVTTHLL
jgi:four helix bundle protein